MKLGDNREGVVVRNRRNKSFYRYVRPEAERTRIRPLELFPNGLLIEKSADTIVASDLIVDVVGLWTEDFYVQDPGAEKLRGRYEAELEEQRGKYEALISEAETIDPKQRGSHANKIKAVERRIESIIRGLGKPTEEPIRLDSIQLDDDPVPFEFLREGAFVVLPSGLIGQIVDMDQERVKVFVKPDKIQITVSIDPVCLLDTSVLTDASS